MINTVRPYGFLKVRYWQRDKQIPEAIISPEDILSAESILPSNVVFGASEVETSTIRLRNEQALVLYNLSLPELTWMIDEAMRERLNIRMSSQSTENVTPKEPLCVCGHDHQSHGDYGNGGSCRGSRGMYHQCECAKWERA